MKHVYSGRVIVVVERLNVYFVYFIIVFVFFMFFLITRRTPISKLLPSTTVFGSRRQGEENEKKRRK